MYSSSSTTAFSVIHIESDTVWCDVARRISQDQGNVDYRGCAHTGRDGLELCRRVQPTLTLIDPSLPDGDGFHVARRLQESGQTPRVLVLSSRMDDVTLFRAWSGRIDGLIWKTSLIGCHLKSAFVAMAAGRRYFSPEVLAALGRFRSSPNAFFKILSVKEQSLIEAFVHGDSDKEIAAGSGLSRHTVHSHRKSIMRKLNLHTVRDLMHWGAERGFYSGRRISAAGNPREISPV